MSDKKPSRAGLEKQPDQGSTMAWGLSIFDQIKDGVTVLSEQRDVLFANKVLEDIFGPWQGRKCYEYFVNRTDVCETCPHPDVLDGKTIRKEWYCSRNGKTYELIDTPLRDPDGRTSHVEVWRDVTDRKRAEEELRRSEEKYSALVEQANDAVIIVQDDVLKFVNKTCAEMAGYSVEEMTGMSMEDIVAPEYRSAVRERYEARLRGENVPSPFEIKAVCRDGTTGDVEFSSALIVYKGRPAVMGIARDITERRRAQDALRGSEERYRAVVENAHMAIVIIQHGEFVFANPMMAGILGCSLENLIGRPFLDVVHPDDRSEVIDMHQKRLRGEPMPASYEGRVVRKDGSVRWLEVSGVPIEWEGRPAALDFALDITERKRTHEKIIRQAGLLQTVSDAIIATDKDFNITSWNKAAERTYGFTEAEVLGRMVDEVTQLEYPNQRREDVVEEFFREGHWQGEVIQKHKNGDRVDIYASVTALRDDCGDVIGAVAVNHDITERKRAQKSLGESEEKYRSLVENSIDGIVIVQGRDIMLVNESMLKTFGCEKESDMVGRPFTDFVTPGLRELMEQRGLAREGGQPVPARYEFKGLRRDGTEFDAEISMARLMYGGRPARQGIIRDISEQKRAEDALKESREQIARYSRGLERMVEARTARIRELERQRMESEKLVATGRMAAKIAHEINNPLAGIKNSFLLVKDIVEKEHPHYAYVDRIESEIDRIAVVVRRMFDLYSPDRKEPREVAIGEVLGDVVVLLESSCRQREIKIEASVPAAPVIAVLPVGYVNQMLFNVVSNAIDASPPGGTVSVSLTADDDTATVEVADQGRGIPEEIADRIFEPFFTTKDGGDTSGLGLGLSITKTMVEASGGSITYESRPSEGTVFTITLPLRPEEDESTGPREHDA